MQPIHPGCNFSKPRLLTTAYALSCVAADAISEMGVLSFEQIHNQPTAARQTERATMATRKSIALAAALGGTMGADQLQNLFADARYDLASIAALFGVPTQHLVNLMAVPAPFPLLPRNWTASSAAGTYVPYVGVVPTAYAGPSTPGYTYGAPLPSREDFS